MVKASDRISTAFQTGEGMFWGEHHPDLFEGTERFFKPGYAANLVENWIPALDGLRETLQAGARVADVGCGHGASTIIMAQAFPNSQFWGFDNHAPSIVHARKAAFSAGVADRVRFDIAGRPTSRAPGTTWSRFSIACTTWGTRRDLCGAPGRR